MVPEGSTVSCLQFEKSDNKGAIIGYGAAGLIAFFFSEWLIHLPLLNFVSLSSQSSGCWPLHPLPLCICRRPADTISFCAKQSKLTCLVHGMDFWCCVICLQGFTHKNAGLGAYKLLVKMGRPLGMVALLTVASCARACLLAMRGACNLLGCSSHDTHTCHSGHEIERGIASCQVATRCKMCAPSFLAAA